MYMCACLYANICVHEYIYIHIYIDRCCFYYFVRNSLVALLEALCARIPFFRFVNTGFYIHVYMYIYTYMYIYI